MARGVSDHPDFDQLVRRITDALPRTIVAVDVRFAMVLDLTDGTIRRTLGVSATRMRGDDWRKLNRNGNESLTQAIGRAAYESNLEGLIVPACDGGKNAVCFQAIFGGCPKPLFGTSTNWPELNSRLMKYFMK